MKAREVFYELVPPSSSGDFYEFGWSFIKSSPLKTWLVVSDDLGVRATSSRLCTPETSVGVYETASFYHG